jgi:hypothetical protein
MGQQLGSPIEEEPMARRNARRAKKPPAFPACGAQTAVPIVYGLPGPDIFEAAERGEVAIGGCVIGRPDGDPHWACPACQHRW